MICIFCNNQTDFSFLEKEIYDSCKNCNTIYYPKYTYKIIYNARSLIKVNDQELILNCRFPSIDHYGDVVSWDVILLMKKDQVVSVLFSLEDDEALNFISLGLPGMIAQINRIINFL